MNKGKRLVEASGWERLTGGRGGGWGGAGSGSCSGEWDHAQ